MMVLCMDRHAITNRELGVFHFLSQQSALAVMVWHWNRLGGVDEGVSRWLCIN